MYVRLVTFTLEPGMGSSADKLAADLGPAIREQNGCKDVTFFGNESDGDYGLFVLWESKEDADAAAAVIGPRLQGALKGIVQAPPDIRLFRVIER